MLVAEKKRSVSVRYENRCTGIKTCLQLSLFIIHAEDRSERFSSRRRGEHLIHRALLRFLVRAPAQESRPMSKAPLREIVVLHLADKLRADRFPFARFVAGPATRPSRNANFE